MYFGGRLWANQILAPFPIEQLDESPIAHLTRLGGPGGTSVAPSQNDASRDRGAKIIKKK